MREYTVLLLYPDYIADEFGKETYIAWVEAGDPEQAVQFAQKDASRHTGWEDGELDDFHPLMVIKGHVSDLTPDRWR